MARLMVVDDEPTVREVMTTILRLDGHEVVEASDGHEALAIVEREPARMPDLILLDLMMPGMGGWRFLETLYRRGLRKRTRVLIVSGTVDPEQPATTGEPTEVLSKPFDVDTLLTAVERALERAPNEYNAERDRSGELAELLADVERTLSR